MERSQHEAGWLTFRFGPEFAGLYGATDARFFNGTRDFEVSNLSRLFPLGRIRQSVQPMASEGRFTTDSKA